MIKLQKIVNFIKFINLKQFIKVKNLISWLNNFGISKFRIFPNDERVKLIIDQDKTILELKKEIASKFNIAYTGFNILYEEKIIDDSKNSCTIKECGIEGEI